MSFRPNMLHEDPPFTRKNTTQFWIQTWQKNCFTELLAADKLLWTFHWFYWPRFVFLQTGQSSVLRAPHVWETPISLGCATQSGCLGINSPCCGVHGMYYIMDDFSAIVWFLCSFLLSFAIQELLKSDVFAAQTLRSSVFQHCNCIDLPIRLALKCSLHRRSLIIMDNLFEASTNLSWLFIVHGSVDSVDS